MPSLLLHADDACLVPDDQSALVHLLTDLGLTGDTWEDEREYGFWPGQQFLSLVMFLGCSPLVGFDPHQAGEGQPVCRLLMHSYSDVKFLSTTPCPAGRCPHCRTGLKVAQDAPHDGVYTCPGCGRSAVVSDLDWRQGAGFGRFFIEIRGIYPHEAVPTDKLLDTLRDSSGTNWRYFYR
jgi:hypothetical protein